MSVDVGCSCGDTSNQNPVHCPDRTRRGVMWDLGLFNLDSTDVSRVQPDRLLPGKGYGSRM